MSESNDVTELRRSSIISTFGPGAVIDFLAEGVAVSGIAAGLEAWDQSFPKEGLRNTQRIREPRLQERLGVKGFRLPPILESQHYSSKPDTRRLLAVRFPKWLQCPQCEYIKPLRRWKSVLGKAFRYCPTCSGKKAGDAKVFVVPVRFVLACKSGHVDEFPWDWWVGHKKDCRASKGDNFEEHRGLLLRSEKPGLEGLILSCPECKASRSMDGVFSHSIWQRGPKCKGFRPWLSNGREECKEEQQFVVQRGASNLYFPVTESALSIPPWSDKLQEILGDWWDYLRRIPDVKERATFIKRYASDDFENILSELNMTASELSKNIEGRLRSYDTINTSNLKFEEYRQFVSGFDINSMNDQEFETRCEKLSSDLGKYFSHLVRVVRLREVRALKGFTRINPPSDPNSDDYVRPYKERLDWLPAIEMRGEGIFIALNMRTLIEWENRSMVRERVGRCNQAYLQHCTERDLESIESYKPISPRYVLCHTLSHALMRQLTLECGYSAAELQERIYAQEDDEEMAGILIYTASPDADGTLGGLERQGKVGRFAEVLFNAIRTMEWCSSDPLCMSDSMNAIDSYSNSVCHACCMVPETACETFNRFLDRGLLIGGQDCGRIGYFEDVLKDR